jgi:uncharacterized membrane protein YeaQ/YmgE (transglycosylase-associated protein family)
LLNCNITYINPSFQIETGFGSFFPSSIVSHRNRKVKSNYAGYTQRKGEFMLMGLLISIVMAIIIGYVGEAIVRSNMPGGVLGSMVAGFVGAWLGALLFGSFGPVIYGFAIIPAIIGAGLFIFLLRLIFRGRRS